jgi:hypothetical protein
MRSLSAATLMLWVKLTVFLAALAAMEYLPDLGSPGWGLFTLRKLMMVAAWACWVVLLIVALIHTALDLIGR